MDKRNVLFLDFDGPLTNVRTYVAFDEPVGRYLWTTADPVVIAYLNALYDKHPYVTVVSSTWRLTALTPTKLSAVDSLRLWGFRGEIHDDWAIKDLRRANASIDDRTSRSGEILDWLSRHRDEVNRWASLDDEGLEPWTNPVRAHETDGLTWDPHFERLRSLLGPGETQYFDWDMDRLDKEGMLE